MSMLRLYTRVLELLGKEARLGWILAIANLLLAGAQFAEPVLFGRIVDVLSGNPSNGPLSSDSTSPWPLLAAWAAFGLFTILCGVIVALHADRLSHRQRQAVLTSYFEHIMQLPLTFHTGTHSGRLMKVMLQGTDALWRLWLGFFREHFAAIMSLIVLLPLSLYINWRLAILLFVLCIVFTVLTTLVVRHRDQHDIRRNRKERAFRERNRAHDPQGVRFVRGLDTPVVNASEHGAMNHRPGGLSMLDLGGTED